VKTLKNKTHKKVLKLKMGKFFKDFASQASQNFSLEYTGKNIIEFFTCSRNVKVALSQKRGRKKKKASFQNM